MAIRHHLTLALTVALVCSPASAQDTAERAPITLGNGSANMIQIEGITRQEVATPTSHIRADADGVAVMRANSTSLTFPRILAAQAGWVVLHPIIDGRPDGDVVSGYAYIETGENADVTVKMPHPTSAGDKYIVMLHKDANEDRVFDFVFVEDGVNVQDTAVFEGNRMIAHMISLPE